MSSMDDLERDNYVYPGTRYTRCGVVGGHGQGMTLHDAAALAALQGLCANPCLTDDLGYEYNTAERAVRMADAFIAARATKGDGQ